VLLFCLFILPVLLLTQKMAWNPIKSPGGLRHRELWSAFRRPMVEHLDARTLLTHEWLNNTSIEQTEQL
jgi:hypothetical protein